MHVSANRLTIRRGEQPIVTPAVMLPFTLQPFSRSSPIHLFNVNYWLWAYGVILWPSVLQIGWWIRAVVLFYFGVFCIAPILLKLLCDFSGQVNQKVI